MGTTKEILFTDTQTDLASILKSFGHPARLSILDQLMQFDSCTCGDIVSRLPLSQSTVSQHLKELKAAGVLNTHPKGTATYYSIDPEAFVKLLSYFQEIAAYLLQQKEQGVAV